MIKLSDKQKFIILEALWTLWWHSEKHPLNSDSLHVVDALWDRWGGERLYGKYTTGVNDADEHGNCVLKNNFSELK